MGFYNKSRGRGGRKVAGQFNILSDDQIAEVLKKVETDASLPIYWQRPNPKDRGSKSYYRYELFMSARTLKEYDELQDSLLTDPAAIAERNRPTFKGDLKDGLQRGFVVIGDDAAAIYKEIAGDSDSES